MSGETQTTIVGNLTADPILRYTQNGAAVVDLTIASTPRSFDRESGQWKDGDTLFLRCTAWRDYAEHIAESLTKGTQVIALVNLKQVSWADKQTGQDRSAIQGDVLEIGPTLRWATTTVQRPGKQGQQTQAQASYAPPTSDPWGTQPAAQADPNAAPF